MARAFMAQTGASDETLENVSDDIFGKSEERTRSTMFLSPKTERIE
jgi:hypothetical protein